MPLKLITGRSGSGKTHKIMNDIIKRLESKQAENIILFVPEQMTFQAEYEIAKRVKGYTYSNLQVFSFKRLAYRIFLEVGGANKEFIQDVAIQMMLTKIIEAKKNDLQIYHKMTTNVNFVSLIYDVIKEFKSYQVKPDSIKSMIDHEQMDDTLRKKLADLLLIFNELNQKLGGTLLDQEDFYHELSVKISQSDYIKNSIIYVDGYHSLTNVEQNVLNELIRHAQEATVLLTIDDLTEHDFHKEDHLFHLVYKTARKIMNFCNDQQINIKMEHLYPPHFPRFKSEALAHLERHYEDDAIYEKNVEGIKLYECISPKSEVHAICREIYHQVVNENARYGDFVIYTNNEQTYYPLILSIFKLYDIPVFIDDQKAMLDHSLLNFIDAVLEIVKTNYRHDAMFRAIKTELMMPLKRKGSLITDQNYGLKIQSYRYEIDQLENYCLSHGVNHQDWLQDHFELNVNKKLFDLSKTKKDADLKREMLLNQLKDEIMTPLKPFVERFKASQTVKDKIIALYDFLMEMDVLNKLALYETIDLNESKGVMDLNQSKKHKQVYNKVMEMFEQLVLVAEHEPVSTEEFIKLLQTGFKSMSFHIVPPAIEQVMVGNIKRSRFEMMGHYDDLKSLGVKKAFVLGVNENEFPRVYSEKGLITNKERQFLIEHEMELNETIEQSFLDENFIVYTVLTSASEELTVLYSLSNENKKEAFPSVVIDKLVKMFPKLVKQTIYDFPLRDEDQLKYITSVPITTSHVLEAINILRKGYDVHDLWKKLYSYYKHHHALQDKLKGVLHQNKPSVITSSDIQALYGDTITASVSSIERFNACPYAFFVEKGLALQERDLKSIEVMDIGDLYHETLKDLALYLMKQNKDFHQVPFEEMSQIINKMINQYARQMQRQYFTDNKRNAYLLSKIKESLLNSIKVMQYQSQHSQFKILAVEEKFGHDATRLVIEEQTLSNGFKMRLKGFIDRIDHAYDGQNNYVRIIDYKSGNRDIDFSKIYHRLSLQLFTYLDAVMQNKERLLSGDVIPAGVLYYHVYNSQIKADAELTQAEIESKHAEEYKMNGYTLADQEVAKLFDDKLNDQTKSDIIKVTLTNNGFHKAHAKVLEREEMDLVRQYTKKAIEESVLELTSGKIDIHPVRYDKQATCKYCKFLSVCKFDNQLKENSYHDLHKLGKKEEIMEHIQNRLEGEGHE